MISIIIPVYNTPLELLKRCLLSIRQQLFTDWETIIINDGSTLFTESDLRSVCGRDNRIRVITQDNKGVSVARNVGVFAAKGEYIAFIDGDDTISKGFLQESYIEAKKYNADMIIGCIEYVPYVDVKQGVLKKKVFRNSEIVDVKKALLGIPQNSIEFSILGTPCGRLYRSEIVKKVLFRENIPLCEDLIFNREFIEEVSCIVVVPSMWYQYYQNDFSAMHYQFNEKYLERMKKFWNVWAELNINEKNEEIKKYLIKSSLSLYMSVVRRSVVPTTGNFLNKRKKMKNILKEKIFCDAIKKLNFQDLKSFKDKVLLFLIKYRILYPIYITQKIKYKRGCK